MFARHASRFATRTGARARSGFLSVSRKLSELARGRDRAEIGLPALGTPVAGEEQSIHASLLRWKATCGTGGGRGDGQAVPSLEPVPALEDALDPIAKLGFAIRGGRTGGSFARVISVWDDLDQLRDDGGVASPDRVAPRGSAATGKRIGRPSQRGDGGDDRRDDRDPRALHHSDQHERGRRDASRLRDPGS
jgi:hypothetical protein